MHLGDIAMHAGGPFIPQVSSYSPKAFTHSYGVAQAMHDVNHLAAPLLYDNGELGLKPYAQNQLLTVRTPLYPLRLRTLTTAHRLVTMSLIPT